MKTSADLMSRIRILVVLGLTGCVTVQQAPVAPQVDTPAEVAAPEVVAVEATPSGMVSDLCDPDLIIFVDTDPEFIYGVGEATSRMRSLARDQALVRARADMARKVGLTLTTEADDMMRSRGADPAQAVIQATFNQKTAESTEATLVGVRLVKASICQMADLWVFTSLVQAREDDILAASLEKVMEATIIEIDKSDTPGPTSDTPGPTSDDIKIFHDEMKARVEDILDKNRRPGGMSYS